MFMFILIFIYLHLYDSKSILISYLYSFISLDTLMIVS